MRNMLFHSEFEICTIILKLHCYTLISMSCHVVVLIWYIVHRMHPQVFIILWTKWCSFTSSFIIYILVLWWYGFLITINETKVSPKGVIGDSSILLQERWEGVSQCVFFINASSTWGSAWLNIVNLHMPHFPHHG